MLPTSSLPSVLFQHLAEAEGRSGGVFEAVIGESTFGPSISTTTCSPPPVNPFPFESRTVTVIIVGSPAEPEGTVADV